MLDATHADFKSMTVSATDIAGYTGDGYRFGVWDPKASHMVFDWEAPKDGRYRLKLRYSSPDDRTVMIRVKRLSNKEIKENNYYPLNQTLTESDWQYSPDVYLDLEQGEYSFSILQYGYEIPNIDHLHIEWVPEDIEEPIDPSFPIDGLHLTAEDAVLAGSTVLQTAESKPSGTGHTGEGFLEFPTRSGDSATWTVDIEEEGKYLLSFRHTNANDRTMQLSINGQEPVTVDFPSTEKWRNYVVSDPIELELKSGVNAIKLETEQSLGPHLDFAELTLDDGVAGEGRFVSAAIEAAYNSGDVSHIDDIGELHQQISKDLKEAYNSGLAIETANYIFAGDILHSITPKDYIDRIEADIWNSSQPGFPIIIGDNHSSIWTASINKDRKAIASVIPNTRFLTEESYYRFIKWLSGRSDEYLENEVVSVMKVGNSGSEDLNVGTPETTVELNYIPQDMSVRPDILHIKGRGLTEEEVDFALDMLRVYPDLPVYFANQFSEQGVIKQQQLLSMLGFRYGSPSSDVSTSYTVEQLETSFDKTAFSKEIINHYNLNENLATDEFPFDLSDGNTAEFKAAFSTPLSTVRKQLNTNDKLAEPIFSDNELFHLSKLYVLLGDVYREKINYPLDHKSEDETPWLHAWFADNTTYYNRDFAYGQADLGNFSEQIENRHLLQEQDIYIEAREGVSWHPTGAYAHPGQPFELTLSSNAATAMDVFINTQRTGSTKEWGKYQRPKYLKSPLVKIYPGQSLTLTSPYGGPIFIEGSLNDDISVKITNSGQHPLFTEETIDGLAEAVEASPYSWSYLDLRRFQLFSQTEYMYGTLHERYSSDHNQLLSEIDTYTVDKVSEFGGFVSNDISLNAQVLSICESKGLDCDNQDWHKRAHTQRANHDFSSHCGVGCSGNPYDSAYKFSATSWLVLHEIGHNIQISEMNINGKGGEVTNNLVPMYVYRSHPDYQDYVRVRDRWPKIYGWMQEGQNVDNTTEYVKDKLWTQSDKDQLALYMQMAYASEYIGYLESGFDIYTLNYLHAREVRNIDSWSQNKDRLGLSLYEERPRLNGNDFMLISLSYFTGYDWRDLFSAWGIPVSETADMQVGTYKNPPMDLKFYIPENDLEVQPYYRSLPLDGTTEWQWLEDID
ncbi:ImpA family metalloprotease [Photobacterium makurazakiensis]|uniref:ImpA family metalloprotease n=1 Tax=Photobacterium makurazakiensis TaxID=2910234 RepID=UPI003D13FA25